MNKQEIEKAIEWISGDRDNYDTRDHAYHYLDLAVKVLTQQLNNGWIPVSEKLPEENGTYIVTQATHSLRDCDKVLRLDTVCVDYSNGTWRRAKHLEVIAWQPLPEPYKEVSE